MEGFWELLDFTVFCEEAAAIIVVVWSNSSLDVDIDIGTTMSFGKFLQHLHFSFKFSSFDLWTWDIDENFSTVQGSIDHRVVWDPCFLANFIGNVGIIEVEDEHTNGDDFLSSDLLNELGQHELVDFSGMSPKWEVSGLEVISTISQNHLGSDTDHLWVEKDDSAVVEGCLVEDGASDLSNNTIGHTRNEEVLDHVPGVEDSVVFKEVVFTGVAGDF